MSGPTLPPFDDVPAWAVAYGRAGYPIIPLRGKEPASWNDRLITSTREDRIRGRWARRRWANVGIATGTISGLLVLEVNADQGGWDALTTLSLFWYTDEWRNLERVLRIIRSPKEVPKPRDGVCGHTVNPPESLTASTGTGHLHCYFALPAEWPPGYSGGEFALGLSLRCDGDYVVAPPSLDPDRWRSSKLRRGRYTWGAGRSLLEQAPPPAPGWLLAELCRLQEPGGRSVGGRT